MRPSVGEISIKSSTPSVRTMSLSATLPAVKTFSKLSSDIASTTASAASLLTARQAPDLNSYVIPVSVLVNLSPSACGFGGVLAVISCAIKCLVLF